MHTITSNFEEDFFERATHLTVSGQLDGGTCSPGPVRNLHLRTNLSGRKFQYYPTPCGILDDRPEMAFYDAEDNQDLAEDFLQYIIGFALENCKEDLAFLDNRAAEEEKEKKAELRSEMACCKGLEFVTQINLSGSAIQKPLKSLKIPNPIKRRSFPFPLRIGEQTFSPNTKGIW